MALPRLGVNIDHVATLRQLRGTPYPDIVEAARLCEAGGADQITVHLREDRRHIQDEDVRRLRAELKVALNLEMAVTDEMVRIASRIRPDWVCLVPEKRREVTTEGGLDVLKAQRRLARAVMALQRAGIKVSLFIEPSLEAVRVAKALGVEGVEFHTGKYCLARQTPGARAAKQATAELERLRRAGVAARKAGIGCHVGHGFDYENVRAVAELVDDAGAPMFVEYNIGHVIVCRAAFVGLERAVREMKSAILAP
ncbi:MAG TPA: pyridoxine 5'-phosphate synthase [Bdellovibrionota bacterium]|jgi:pyridoxine 5-phosphate synthase|nr:pyridoxine 5'-phosphate synthase [Bdellovibrionota bacterium]